MDNDLCSWGKRPMLGAISPYGPFAPRVWAFYPIHGWAFCPICDFFYKICIWPIKLFHARKFTLLKIKRKINLCVNSLLDQILIILRRLSHISSCSNITSKWLKLSKHEYLSYFSKEDVQNQAGCKTHTPEHYWWLESGVYTFSLCSVAWAFCPAWASCPYLPHTWWIR